MRSQNQIQFSDWTTATTTNYWLLCINLVSFNHLLTLFFFLAILCGLWDLSSLTRDGTRASQKWKHKVPNQGIPPFKYFQFIYAFNLKWISYTRHRIGSCFLTHPDNLFLISAFRSMTFKVITDIAWLLSTIVLENLFI